MCYVYFHIFGPVFVLFIEMHIVVVFEHASVSNLMLYSLFMYLRAEKSALRFHFSSVKESNFLLPATLHCRSILAYKNALTYAALPGTKSNVFICIIQCNFSPLICLAHKCFLNLFNHLARLREDGNIYSKRMASVT